MVRDFQSTPTVQQKLGTVGGADSSRASHARINKKNSPRQRQTHVPRVERYMCVGVGRDKGWRKEMKMEKKEQRRKEGKKKKNKKSVTLTGLLTIAGDS